MSTSPGWELGEDNVSAAPRVVEQFLAAMGTLAATVTVIAAASPTGPRTGITATAVCSLSNDPPSLVACVNRSSSLATALTTTRWFSVNLLGDHQLDVASVFAGRTGAAGEDRFTAGAWSPHPTGAPVLADTAITCVCHVANSMNQATHLIVVGTVQDVIAPTRTVRPLMYHDRTFVSLGSAIQPLSTSGGPT